MVPTGNPHTERNAQIEKLLSEKRLSYGVIAEMTGTTRNAVGGVAFRIRHPRGSLVPSPNSPGKPNKIGTGWRPASYQPEKTTVNTR